MTTHDGGSGLTLHGVGVRYGDVVAVAGANLTVDVGEIVAVTGPSGGGKSSLLSAIAGIVAYTGRIAWNDEDLASVPVHRRGVGLVFQDGQLFPHRSVARNIEFGLEMAKVPAVRRREVVSELLELVGLGGLGDRAPTELSGGQRQRVALARSLAVAPRVLLLDEPLSSLDASLRDRLGADMRDILKARGTTTILVTHDEAEAELIATRVVRIDAGTLQPL